MKQYLELVSHVIQNGTKQANRTGINTISFPGAMLRFDLQEGFPAITRADGLQIGHRRDGRISAWRNNALNSVRWVQGGISLATKRAGLANLFRRARRLGESTAKAPNGRSSRSPPPPAKPRSNKPEHGSKQIAQGEKDGQE